MPAFRTVHDWPIERKLLLIILATVVLSLALVTIGVASYELATYRTRLAREVAAVGGFIAANSASTLAFDDAQTAQEILNTLTGSPSVAAATLYTKEGRVFASYVRSGQPPVTPPPRPEAAGLRFSGSYLEFVHPLQQKGRQLGMLYLRADMAGVYARLAGYARILLVVALAIGSGALLLKRLLQRLVSKPLLRLSAVADTIAKGNLTTRIAVESADEIGQLAEAFNHMSAELASSYEVLRESEGRYRMLFDSIDEGYCIVEVTFDEEGKPVDYLFLETNPSFQKQTGLSDVKGKRMRELAPNHEEYWYQTYGRVALSGEPERFQGRAEQLHRWYDVYVFRFGAAESRQVAILFNDITDRKTAESELLKAKDELEVRVQERTAELNRALQELRAETDQRLRAVDELRSREQLLMQQSRLAAMGEMLVNISHQWRQPLNVVGLLLQDLTRGQQRGTFTPELLEKNVSRARELISHMSQTIDDFRSYLNPEKTKLPFDVREVVARTVSLVGESLRGMQLEVTSADDQPIMVNGFRNEYAQVLINILMNARDAFRERGVQAPCITVKIAKEENTSVVIIADNAGGIAQEIIGRIFEPYFTTKGPDKGTGIGLFMSKNIIEKNMGGHLTVRNTAEGAEFRIEV